MSIRHREAATSTVRPTSTVTGDPGDSKPASLLSQSQDLASFGRDLLFIVAGFAYAIGFTYHSAEMNEYGIETQLADQPPYVLFNWAADVLQGDWPVFALIFLLVWALLAFTAHLREHALQASRWRLAIVYGTASASVIVGLILTCVFSSHEGSCRGRQFLAGRLHGPPVRFQLKSGEQIGDLSDPSVPPPEYILGETDEFYQIAIEGWRKQKRFVSTIAVPRSLVDGIVYRTSWSNEIGDELGASAGDTQLPSGIPTPAPDVVGGKADAATDLDCEEYLGLPTIGKLGFGLRRILDDRLGR